MVQSDIKRLEKLKRDFNELFKAAIEYIELHPKARIEAMDTDSRSPYVWIVMDEGAITITTEFIIKG